MQFVLVVVPAIVGALGSILSAYIAVKVRSTANRVNGQVQELARVLVEVERERGRERGREADADAEGRAVVAEVERLRRAHPGPPADVARPVD